MQWGLVLLTIAAGAGLVLQTAMNAGLGSALGRPILGTAMNFVVGLGALLLFILATRTPMPSREMISSAPAWVWFGGLMGALYVGTVTVAGPRLGAIAILALSVAGQLIASVVVDHFGLLGFPQQTVGAVKILGVLLVCAGVVLVLR
jgi:transporter family-2 protein